MNPARPAGPPARAVDLDYLTLSMCRHGGRARLIVAGELDQATAPALDAALERVSQLDQTVYVDLGSLTFCDCAGLEVLLSHHQRLTASGGTLTLLNPTRSAWRLLTLTGLDQHLDIRADPVTH